MVGTAAVTGPGTVVTVTTTGATPALEDAAATDAEGAALVSGLLVRVREGVGAWLEARVGVAVLAVGRLEACPPAPGWPTIRGWGSDHWRFFTPPRLGPG